MKNYTFNSTITVTPEKIDPFPQEVVKNEPMLFNCDVDSAYRLGGSLTRSFIEGLHKINFITNDTILDSRVHMLMPGWYPCIPGYHHDDVPRSREDKQPNYDTPEYLAEHCMALVNGDICPTQFAKGTIDLPEIPLNKGPIYKHWHGMVDEAVKSGKLEAVKAPDRSLILFDWQAFHQGTVAVSNGWRFFIRASRNTHRKPTNELRRQVQAYLPAPMEGW